MDNFDRYSLFIKTKRTLMSKRNNYQHSFEQK